MWDEMKTRGRSKLKEKKKGFYDFYFFFNGMNVLSHK